MKEIDQFREECVNIVGKSNGSIHWYMKFTALRKYDIDFLGTILTLSFLCYMRVSKANQAMFMIKTVWNNNKNFSVHTKIIFYEIIVRTILLYGDES